jgi:hypothetical protein
MANMSDPAVNEEWVIGAGGALQHQHGQVVQVKYVEGNGGYVSYRGKRDGFTGRLLLKDFLQTCTRVVHVVPTSKADARPPRLPGQTWRGASGCCYKLVELVKGVWTAIDRGSLGGAKHWRDWSCRGAEKNMITDSGCVELVEDLPTNLAAAGSGLVRGTHVSVPAQHPSDAKRTATCIKVSGNCKDVGEMRGLSALGLCAWHYLDAEKVIAAKMSLGMGRPQRAPVRAEPYEGLHAHLQVACLPKGTNPAGWERRK